MVIKIIGICGSNRKSSYNMALLKYVEKIKTFDFEIVDISTLPIFNEDMENPNPLVVDTFKEKLKQADGYIIATPEHNYSIPALLKNALDWASRGEEKVLDNKNIIILSASPGILGGSRAQYHLRQICVCLNLLPINRPEIFISKANEKIDDNGNINDIKTQELINKAVNNLTNIIKERM